MAGFFDSLLGSESDPRRRDYRLASEITDPEEMEAYRAGESASGFPGLDYARSVVRGVGKEITEPSMGPLGERYQQTMAEHEARMRAARELQERYPEAFRSGRLVTSGNMPGAEAGLFMQPGAAGLARGAMRPGARGAGMTPRVGGPGAPRALPAPSNIIEGEFSEAPPIASIGHNRPPIEPSNSQRPMSRFEANQGYMTTRVPGNDIYGSSVGRVPRTSMNSFRDAPVKPTAGIHDENYMPVGDQRAPFKPGYEPSKFDQNMFDAWRNAQIRRRGNRIDPAERFGGYDTELATVNPRQAARAADEAYDTPGSNSIVRRGSTMPRSTMIEGEFTEVPNAGGGGRGAVPPGAVPPGATGFPGSRLPLFARNAAGAAAGLGLYGAGQTAYDRAMEILNRQNDVISKEPGSGRKVQLPPIDVGGPRPGAGKSVPLPPRRPADLHPAAPAQRRAAPKAAVDDGRRYWGDWRDVDPYANDPIGNAIDALMGEEKRARKPGHLAHGGQARGHYAEGGGILDSLTGLLGGGGEGGGLKGFRPGPVSQGLMTAGLGMMASPQKSALRAIGEGGIAGIKAYNVANDEFMKEQKELRDRMEDLEFERKARSGPGLRRGGVARSHYAMGGGQSGDFGPFGEIGDAIGSGLQSVGDAVGSFLMPSAEAAEETPRRRRGPGPISEGLMTAGLGMMASPSKSAFRAIGEGGLRGVQAYQTSRALRDKEDREEADRAADEAFTKSVAGGPSMKPEKAPSPDIEVPTGATAKPKAAEAEAEPKPAADRVVATDRKEEDPITASMKRISWLNSLNPRTPGQERTVTRLINEEKFKIQLAQKQQSGSNGVIGVIGNDATGQPIRGYISGPRAGERLVLKDQPGDLTAPDVAAKHGDEYLKTLDPKMQDWVRAIAEGRARLPSGQRGATVKEIVTQYDPDFREQRFDTLQSAAKLTPNTIGGIRQSGNMAIQHMGELSDAIEDLKRAELAGGRLPPLNTLWQAVRPHLPGGMPALGRYKTAMDRFNEEATRFYRGTGGNQADIQRMIERMNSARTPQELHDILETEMRYFSGRVEGTRSTYDDTMGSRYIKTPDFDPLDDQSKDIMKMIQSRVSKNYQHQVHDIVEKNREKRKSEAQPGSSAPAQPNAPTPVSSGTYKGRAVTKYSDGSVRDDESGDFLKGPQAQE